MAVVSISRIQVRRGRRTDLPQLASGEFGWAVDSQEIFIGNGAVSEGAPYVGNTKLLSEHDDLFQLADQYVYKDGTTIQTGISSNSPVERTLQSRLDEIVSLASFGSTGDGTDHTTILQRALDQLFLGPSTKNTETARVVLYVPPGIYDISSTVFIPPFASIVGAGIDKTIFRATRTLSQSMFRTQNSLAEPGLIGDRDFTTTGNQCKNLKLSEFTLFSLDQTGIMLDCCRDSIFSNIEIAGGTGNGPTDQPGWQTTNPTGPDDVGIELVAKSGVVTTNNNYFTGIEIRNKRAAVVSNDDVKNNSFDVCSFNDCLKGFDLGSQSIDSQIGQAKGPSHTLIQNSKFDLIAQEGILVTKGNYNLSKNNRFYNVGDNNGSPNVAQFPIINFVDDRNQSNDDWFQRSIDLGNNVTYRDAVYPAEIQGNVISDMRYTHQLDESVIKYSPAPTKIIGLAADSKKSITVDYIYKSLVLDYTRTGTLTITINPSTGDHQISDEFDYIGLVDNANPYEERLEFSLTLSDKNSDSLVDTVDLSMLNLISIEEEAKIKYRISVRS